MEKLNGETLNIVNENIEKLKQLFPEAFREGKIDFETLKAELGESVENAEERYSFNWNGKAAARRIARRRRNRRFQQTTGPRRWSSVGCKVEMRWKPSVPCDSPAARIR